MSKNTSLQNLNLLEQILRNKVFNCLYWKENCFGLTSETIIDKILELKYIGGINTSSNQPTNFICILVKLLQLNPKEEIIDEFLSDPELKYLRAITAVYIRFVYPPAKVYSKLEKLYCDYKKLIMLNKENKFEIIHMDELIDILLNEDFIFDISLPKIVKRNILEEKGELKPYVSVLEKELNNENDNDKKDDSDDESDVDIFNELKLPDNFFKNKKRKRSEDKKEESRQNKNINKNKKMSKEENKREEKNKDKKEGEEQKIKLPNLDPSSDEYWLELRKTLGIN